MPFRYLESPYPVYRTIEYTTVPEQDQVYLVQCTVHLRAHYTKGPYTEVPGQYPPAPPIPGPASAQRKPTQ